MILMLEDGIHRMESVDDWNNGPCILDTPPRPASNDNEWHVHEMAQGATYKHLHLHLHL